MIREISALLRGTEIVILLITLAYFAGYSVGYGFARKLSFRTIRKLALVAWGLHLTLPFSFRYVGAFFYKQVLAGVAFTLLLFLTAFALSGFYSILLPRFIDLARDKGQSLVSYYSVELGGAVMGAVALFLVGRSGWATSVVYQAALALLIVLLWQRPLVWVAAVGLVGVYALFQPSIDMASLSYSYAQIQGLTRPQILKSSNTFYQRVDFLDDADGDRYIYLNGRMNYGSDALRAFNVTLSKLPAALLRPKQALIVGSGSMESVGYVSEFAGHVTTCELDQAVIEGSRRYLADVNRLADVTNWTLHINDAKQFLGSTDQRFDLIVMDVPLPSTIQLGILHSVDFYRLARSRLTPHGVISVSLSGKFRLDNEMPQTVAAAVVAAFPDVVIYTDKEAGRSFALGSDSFGFTKDDVIRASTLVGLQELTIFDRPEILRIVKGIEPMTADNMKFIVRRGWTRVKELFSEGGD